MKPPAYIFDVDGTLALRGDRDPYDASHAIEDRVNEDVGRMLSLIYYDYRADIFIVTGRSARHRDVTERWLRVSGIPFDQLYMRADDDNRPDHVVKREILHEHILPRYKVLGVFDDRDSVVAMWREEGLTCFQVAPGDF